MSSRPTRADAARRTIAVSAIAALTLSGLAATSSTALAADQTARGGPSAAALPGGTYVVILDKDPSAGYDGGIAGYAATMPEAGAKFAPRSKAVTRYERLLTKEQDAILESVDARATYRYATALNGFSAKLTGAQATTLAGTRGVLAVTKDEVRKVDTVTSPAFLGLTGPTGVWSRVGGQDTAGEGTVVGVIDSGIWPESASFSGPALGTTAGGAPYVTGNAPDTTPTRPRTGITTRFDKSDETVFTGRCEDGELFDASDCNTKLISARYFDSGFLAGVPVANRDPNEVISTRDGDGHGSHTASTAAGNKVEGVTIDGDSFGTASGMAPGAKVAAYKVCWEDNDDATGGCYTSDSIAAINQAVIDNVDVLNYSISGTTSSVVDGVSVAFLNATLAGIFVATSAGNSGPTASTVNHGAPWVTSTAATTSARVENTAITGDGKKYRGASNNKNALPQTPLILSTSIGAASATANDVRLCAPGSLTEAAAGKVVLCDRGVVDRVAKSAEVKRVGGVGMLLANTSPNSLDSDIHFVPTVHVDALAGAKIKAYIASAGAAATIAFQVGDKTTGPPTPLPQVAGFSSRGPLIADNGNIIKPDISAPGVSIVAAVAPPTNYGRDYNVISGTSMASPHIAGLAALILGEYPTWSPSAVKSAMMTTAYDTRTAKNGPNRDPFAQGAGHVNPKKFLTPGLLVETPAEEYLRYAFDQAGIVNANFPPLSGTDLNQPSIAVGSLAGTQTVSRTFTAVQPGAYVVNVYVPGFKAKYQNRRDFAKAGDASTLDITFTRTTAKLGEFATGFVTLTGRTTVRLPVALRPVSIAAPAEVNVPGTATSTAVTVTPGFSGELPITTAGFAEGNATESSVVTGDSDFYEVTIPEGTSLARFDVDAVEDTADLDLSVYKLDADGELESELGVSATGSADERVDALAPAPGNYLVIVDGYAAANGQTTTAYTYTDFAVTPETTLGGLTVTPNPVQVTQGRPVTLTASWTGLDPAKSYLGWIGYEGSTTPTILSIN